MPSKWSIDNNDDSKKKKKSSKRPSTIYVSDPNDPRLQAYNDSLSLYNNYIDVTKALKNKNYI